MNQEEILKKDWQLLTAASEIQTLTYLKTIYEYQLVILAKLTDRPLDEIIVEADKAKEENFKQFHSLIQKNIRENPDKR